MPKKVLLVCMSAVLAAGASIYAAFQVSPWPSVLLIRYVFNRGAAETAVSQAALVPKGGSELLNLSYAPGKSDAKLNVFGPTAATVPLPAVVWVHGGAFVAGTRDDLTNYAKILAGRGFVVVPIDYDVAPTAEFPTPVRQTNAALSYVLANAGRFRIDPRRIFLAGDSAGAQIAAQTALVISDPNYAHRMGLTSGMPRGDLRGLILFCGPYDPRNLNFESAFGGFMRTVIWSYLGTRDPRDPRLGQMAVTPHVTSDYPPAFISVGNADPLAPQSVALAKALRAKGVQVATLFFAKDYQPPLPHEYQLDLSTQAAREALERAVDFLNARSGRPAAGAK